MKNNLVGLINLFCATCCQLEPGLPLMYHKTDESYEYSREIIDKMYDIAFDHIKLYKSYINAKSVQQQQFIKLDLIELFENEFGEILNS